MKQPLAKISDLIESLCQDQGFKLMITKEPSIQRGWKIDAVRHDLGASESGSTLREALTNLNRSIQ